MKQPVSFILSILFTLTACGEEKRGQSFTPGKWWYDNNDVHINAHGGEN